MKHIHDLALDLDTITAATESRPAPAPPSRPSVGDEDEDGSSTPTPTNGVGRDAAERIVQWIARRWPMQWLRGMPPAAVEEIMEGWLVDVAQMTHPALRRAYLAWHARPYPPDLGAFLASSRRQDALELFEAAARAAGQSPPAWYTLSPLAFACARQYMKKYGGTFSMKTGSWKAAEERWCIIVDELTPLDDRGELPPPPPPPAGELPRPRRPEVIEQELAKIKQLLRRAGED